MARVPLHCLCTSSDAPFSMLHSMALVPPWPRKKVAFPARGPEGASTFPPRAQKLPRPPIARDAVYHRGLTAPTPRSAGEANRDDWTSHDLDGLESLLLNKSVQHIEVPLTVWSIQGSACQDWISSFVPQQELQVRIGCELRTQTSKFE